jgi:hypothetical protein
VRTSIAAGPRARAVDGDRLVIGNREFIGFQTAWGYWIAIWVGIPIHVWVRWRSSKAPKAPTGDGKLPVPLGTTELELTRR